MRKRVDREKGVTRVVEKDVAGMIVVNTTTTATITTVITTAIIIAITIIGDITSVHPHQIMW